jgi:hypothetical protein
MDGFTEYGYPLPWQLYLQTPYQKKGKVSLQQSTLVCGMCTRILLATEASTAQRNHKKELIG